jgi:phosphoglycerate dehydrogenase-like enzyme
MNRNINIAVVRLFAGRAMDAEAVKKIVSVNRGISLSDVTDLVHAEFRGDLSRKQELDAALGEAEILYAFPPPKDLMARARKLKWIQVPIAGVEPFLVTEVIESPVLLTNAHGMHATQVAELAVTHMLMLAKKAIEFWPARQEGRWIEGLIPGLLYANTAAILGYGSIGQEIGRLAKAFKMKVIGLRSHPERRAKYADVMVGADRLKDVMAQADYVVNVLPLTPQTKGIIGEAELRAMKPTAYLVNVGRGATIDEQAMVRALKEKWIAGAGLDVYAERPLRPSSALWKLPNVIMTPHCGGQRADYDILGADLFARNIRLYLSGKPLMNLVDKRKGY